MKIQVMVLSTKTKVSCWQNTNFSDYCKMWSLIQNATAFLIASSVDFFWKDTVITSGIEVICTEMPSRSWSYQFAFWIMILKQVWSSYKSVFYKETSMQRKHIWKKLTSFMHLTCSNGSASVSNSCAGAVSWINCSTVFTATL